MKRGRLIKYHRMDRSVYILPCVRHDVALLGAIAPPLFAAKLVADGTVDQETVDMGNAIKTCA